MSKGSEVTETVGMALVAAGCVMVTIIILGLLVSWPVMMLWNYCLVPAIPALMPVGWLQSWGILIICGALFKTSTVTRSK
jgi:hypothetical protein